MPYNAIQQAKRIKEHWSKDWSKVKEGGEMVADWSKNVCFTPPVDED